jgi:uncharacterized protein
MKTLDELPIKIDREKIAQFYRERGIRKLSLFGSMVRDDFDPERSDVDVMVSSCQGRRRAMESSAARTRWSR